MQLYSNKDVTKKRKRNRLTDIGSKLLWLPKKRMGGGDKLGVWD